MDTNEARVRIHETVQQYFDGLYQGNCAMLRSAFSAEATVIGYYHGDLRRQSMNEWMAEVEELPKPTGQGEQFDMEIVESDVTVNIAHVKTSVLYFGMRFTDYLTLVEIDKRWIIVHKAYYHERAEPA